MTKKYYPPKPKSISMTKQGLDEAKVEYEQKSKLREEILVRLQTAREMGDLSENGAYKYAKFELRDCDRRLRHLSKLIKHGVVVEETREGVVGFDSKVVINNGKSDMEFRMVSGYESDPTEKKLSVYSPIGKAIMGKSVGDTVTVEIPAGKTKYKILSVE